jgi:hypothetical protein
MTDREKAIVMAYTGACMLTGDKFQIFHKYVEEIMGRPIWTHEMAQLADEIKEKSKDDFMKLCADENLNEWIPVSERLPEDGQSVLFCDIDNDIMVGYHVEDRPRTHFSQDGTYEDIKNVRAWMSLPEPYRVESEGKK